MRRSLLTALPLLMSAPVHAAWLHACPAAAPTPEHVQAEARAGGLRWFVDERASLPGCSSVPLAPGARVQTLVPLDAGERPERTILLHGTLADGRFAVNEHELPSNQPAPAAPAPMPLHANLLAGMTARVFGAEERAQARIENGQLIVDCRAGTRAAGVVLTGPWYLPRARLVLDAAIAGDAAGFGWQAADAARAERGDALDMAALPGGGQDKHLRLAVPDKLERAGWRQFVLLCPNRAASLHIASLTLEPAAAPTHASEHAPRATWVWRPGDWIDKGAALLDWAAGQGMQELFVTVPLKDGAGSEKSVRSPELLAGFVREAGARGIRVLSVDGDPHMVLASELPNVAQRVRAYAAYNAQVAPDARLAGIQFDIEPYLLPDTVLPPGERDARYLAMAAALRASAGELHLEFVVPFWWGGKRDLLDGLAPYADALAVMDYRTDPAQVYDFAVPFLDWAAAHGRQARIALEAGPIEPELQRRYARAGAGEAGELQVLELGGRRVLALLSTAVTASDAELYRLQSTRDIDGSATTFHRDKAALLRLLPRLEADLKAWDGFKGIAVHELR